MIRDDMLIEFQGVMYLEQLCPRNDEEFEVLKSCLMDFAKENNFEITDVDYTEVRVDRYGK